jgi:hypothetical protein
MAIRIPSNITVKSQYTAGKQYMYESTQREYQGYYYEMNGKIFAGKEFSSNAPTLLKITPNNINSLLTSAATYVYGKITGTKIPISIPSSYYFNPDTTDNIFRYFTKKMNDNIIKEINEDTFNQIKANPMYVSVSLYYQSNFNENELNKAEEKIPGLKTYINSTYTPGVTD